MGWVAKKRVELQKKKLSCKKKWLCSGKWCGTILSHVEKHNDVAIVSRKFAFFTSNPLVSWDQRLACYRQNFPRLPHTCIAHNLFFVASTLLYCFQNGLPMPRKKRIATNFLVAGCCFFECRKEEEKILDGYVIVYVHWSCFYCECCYWQEFLNDDKWN